MRKLITEEQKREIENLASDGHYDALISFGADMYHRGIIKGAILATVGIIGGVAVTKIVKVVKTKISKKSEKVEKEEESQ